MAIREKDLEQLIKELKKNGYKVTRDGAAPTEEGFARGVMKIRHKDKQRFGIVHEIDLSVPENWEAIIRERFGL